MTERAEKIEVTIKRFLSWNKSIDKLEVTVEGRTQTVISPQIDAVLKDYSDKRKYRTTIVDIMPAVKAGRKRGTNG